MSTSDTPNTTDAKPWQPSLSVDMDDEELAGEAIETWFEWLVTVRGKGKDINGLSELYQNVCAALQIARTQESMRHVDSQ